MEKKYPEVIEKIHSEYYKASGLLVQEAKSIINNIKINEDKYCNLKALGLTNTPEFKMLESEYLRLCKQKEITDMVEQYRIKYPNNKFISTEDVITINKKYGLILGGLTDFKGFVPQSNLNDIVKFKETHLVNKKITYHVEISKCEYTSHRFEDKNKEIVKLFGGKRGFSIYVSTEADPDATPTLFKEALLISLRELNSLLFTDMAHDWESYTLNYSIKQPVLCICATGKEMGLTESETKRFSTGLFNLLKTKQKEYTFKVEADPIVLHPVKGGYIIVTAWGDEASDPLVIDHNKN